MCEIYVAATYLKGSHSTKMTYFFCVKFDSALSFLILMKPEKQQSSENYS